ISLMRIRHSRGRFTPRLMPCSQSPNSRNEAPADALRIIIVARQLRLQHAILVDRAIKKEWHCDGDKKRGRKPGAKRYAACHEDQYAGAVARMPNKSVWAARDHVLPPIGLYAHDRGEKAVHHHRPEHQRIGRDDGEKTEHLQPQGYAVAPMQ